MDCGCVSGLCSCLCFVFTFECMQCVWMGVYPGLNHSYSVSRHRLRQDSGAQCHDVAPRVPSTAIGHSWQHSLARRGKSEKVRGHAKVYGVCTCRAVLCCRLATAYMIQKRSLNFCPKLAIRNQCGCCGPVGTDLTSHARAGTAYATVCWYSATANTHTLLRIRLPCYRAHALPCDRT